MKSWAAVLALVTVCGPAPAQEFKGKLIFSVEEVEWSQRLNEDGSRGPKKSTGIFYYYREAEPGHYGPLIDVYRLQEGEIVDAAGPGSLESAQLLKDLTALPLATFDVEQEMEIARREQRAKHGPTVLVRDGAKYRIRYDFNGASIDYIGWNPGPIIDSLAPYSENLRNLKAVIDLFAKQFGRRKFGL